MNTDDYLTEMRDLVRDNKRFWRQLERDKVASYTWLARFSEGAFKNPGVHTLQKVRDAIDSANKTAAA